MTKADKKQMLDQFNGQLEELKKLITMTQKEISDGVKKAVKDLTAHISNQTTEINEVQNDIRDMKDWRIKRVTSQK